MDGFSWKRGLKHAGLAGLLVMVLGIALVVAYPVKNPEKLGEGTGQFAFFVMAIALGASYLAQTGRKVAALALAVVVIGGIVALAAVVVSDMHGHKKPPASFRVPLLETERGGEKWLEQPGLGFSLRHPGPTFKEAPQFAAMMKKSDPGEDSIYYAYADSEPSAVLLVGVLARQVEDKHDFEQFVDGTMKGMNESVARNLGSSAQLEVIERNVDWSNREARFHVAIGAAHFRVRFVAVPDASTPYLVMAMVMAQSPDALAPVLPSLQHR